MNFSSSTFFFFIKYIKYTKNTKKFKIFFRIYRKILKNLVEPKSSCWNHVEQEKILLNQKVHVRIMLNKKNSF
jgi:hypothetical protein